MKQPMIGQVDLGMKILLQVFIIIPVSIPSLLILNFRLVLVFGVAFYFGFVLVVSAMKPEREFDRFEKFPLINFQRYI